MHNKDIDDFDSFICELQEQVYKKDREDFSEYALSLAKEPYKYGKLDEDDSSIIKYLHRGPCGDAIILYLKIKDDTIVDISYEVDGCTTSVIAGSQMVKMVEGKNIADALTLSQDDILSALGKFPKSNHHCALLAADTLHHAINKYKNKYNY